LDCGETGQTSAVLLTFVVTDSTFKQELCIINSELRAYTYRLTNPISIFLGFKTVQRNWHGCRRLEILSCRSTIQSKHKHELKRLELKKTKAIRKE
jgi:hypothetical protein